MNMSRATKVTEERIMETLMTKRRDGKGYKGYSPLFAAFECGEIGPVEFFHILTSALDCGRHIDFDTFARIWVDIFDKENRALDRLLALLPQKKYLLSNTNKLVHGRYIAECRIIRNHFPSRADRILSYDVGAIKPDPVIYRAALATAKVDAMHALFIDDMPENIDAWRMLGGHGIVYHAGTDRITVLKKEFRAFGLIP